MIITLFPLPISASAAPHCGGTSVATSLLPSRGGSSGGRGPTYVARACCIPSSSVLTQSKRERDHDEYALSTMSSFEDDGRGGAAGSSRGYGAASSRYTHRTGIVGGLRRFLAMIASFHGQHNASWVATGLRSVARTQ